MSLSQIRKKTIELQKKREVLELKLIRQRSKMEQGSLIKKFTACRKGNCKCNKGELHGPFIYLSQKVEGKLKQRYAGKDSDKQTVEKVKRYMKYQDILADIRKINKEFDLLFNSYRDELTIKR